MSDRVTLEDVQAFFASIKGALEEAERELAELDARAMAFFAEPRWPRTIKVERPPALATSETIAREQKRVQDRRSK